MDTGQHDDELHRRFAELERRLAEVEADNHCLRADNQGRKAEVRRLTDRLAQYEPEIRQEAAPAAAAEVRPTDYGLEGEAQRRHRRKRRRTKKSPGRRPTEFQFNDAQRYDDIYPADSRRSDCTLARQRTVWRLENGRAMLVGYRIFAGPDCKESPILGVTPRCEYGIEILVVLAFLVYLIGISLDKACVVLRFFCQLPLAKSQADALLRQLAQHGEGEFDLLGNLIAHAAVVYMDETGWKIGSETGSLWAFASKLQCVFVFGCRKDDVTLDPMLPPEVFDGIGVSDDAAVYQGRFAQAQKCWAHLLRKAIKLTLLYPRKRTYQRFLDRLLQLYYDAKRVSADGRLAQEGRAQRVADREGRLCTLCRPYGRYGDEAAPGTKPHERDFLNLVNEWMRLLMAEELFTFVLVPEVEPTNHSSEGRLRNAAQERKAGRTSKTAAGAHRRSVLVSVLESLRANLEPFKLASVLEEISRWMSDGLSMFARQWQAIQDAKVAPLLSTG